MVKVKKHHALAALPVYQQAGDVCADLVAIEEMKIPSRGRAVVQTGIALELPEGFRGRVLSRSGLALHYGIEAGAGVIDQGHRAPIGVLLHNHGERDYWVKPGDRVAQLAIERFMQATFVEVDEIEASGRSQGWGSSGR